MDGQGNLYWDGQGTHLNNNKPRFFRISIDNGLLEDVRVKNCPVLCILIRNSNNLVVRGWNIDNLEGDEVSLGKFHVTQSKNRLEFEFLIIMAVTSYLLFVLECRTKKRVCTQHRWL